MADLPLESIAWHAEVTGAVANLTIDHTFRNDTDRVIEGTSVFPLPAGATVDRMRSEVGVRTIEGRVVDRGQAWSLWDAAKKRRQFVPFPDAAKAYRYSQYLTNIRPGESVHVVLGVVGPITRQDGA